jgi:hypothetical protein
MSFPKDTASSCIPSTHHAKGHDRVDEEGRYSLAVPYDAAHHALQSVKSAPPWSKSRQVEDFGDLLQLLIGANPFRRSDSTSPGCTPGLARRHGVGPPALFSPPS